MLTILSLVTGHWVFCYKYYEAASEIRFTFLRPGAAKIARIGWKRLLFRTGLVFCLISCPMLISQKYSLLLASLSLISLMMMIQAMLMAIAIFHVKKAIKVHPFLRQNTTFMRIHMLFTAFLCLESIYILYQVLKEN